MKNLSFAGIKRGSSGEGLRLDACNAFCCICLPYPSQLSYFFILELIILCICKKLVFSFVYSNMELLPTLCCFWIFIWKIFLFTIGGYDMALTRDSDSKNYWVLKTSTSELKISDIWPTFQHVWDMSKTFPTKLTMTNNGFVQKLVHAFKKAFPSALFILIILNLLHSVSAIVGHRPAYWNS